MKMISIHELKEGDRFLGPHGLATVKTIKLLPMIADHQLIRVTTMMGNSLHYLDMQKIQIIDPVDSF